MPLRKIPLNRRPPTKIVRRPIRGQLDLGLRPRERLATRRRRARMIAAAVMLVVVGIGVWGTGLLSHHQRLIVHSVSVMGANALAASAVEATAQGTLDEGAENFFSSKNIFLYPRKMLELGLLQEFPRLRTVSAARPSLFAQAVVVTVTERIPHYTWCKGSNCYLMDENGFIFANTDGSTTAYVFRGGLMPTEEPIGQTFLRGRLEDLIALLSDLKAAGFTPSEVIVDNETDMQVILSEGLYLKAVFNSAPSKVTEDLKLITSSETLQGKLNELEYVDLRFGNRVYYQFK